MLCACSFTLYKIAVRLFCFIFFEIVENNPPQCVTKAPLPKVPKSPVQCTLHPLDGVITIEL